MVAFNQPSEDLKGHWKKAPKVTDDVADVVRIDGYIHQLGALQKFDGEQRVHLSVLVILVVIDYLAVNLENHVLDWVDQRETEEWVHWGLCVHLLHYVLVNIMLVPLQELPFVLVFIEVKYFFPMVFFCSIVLHLIAQDQVVDIDRGDVVFFDGPVHALIWRVRGYLVTKVNNQAKGLLFEGNALTCKVERIDVGANHGGKTKFHSLFAVFRVYRGIIFSTGSTSNNSPSLIKHV